MKTLQMLSIFLLLAAIGACKARRDESVSNAASYPALAKLPAITCQKGELMPFHLESQDLSPSGVKFGRSAVEEEYNLMKPSRELNVRLDVCVHADQKLDLKRLVFVFHPDEEPIAILPNRFSEVKGLDAAVFQDDHKQVWIEVSQGSQQDGYLLKGWGGENGSFVTFSPIRKEASGALMPKEPNLLFGKIVYGDPWLAH